MGKIEDITNELFAARFKVAFNHYVGPSKPINYSMLSIMIDVDKRTIESWAYGDATPSGARLFRCLKALGVDFSNMVLGICGLTVTHIDEKPIAANEILRKMGQSLINVADNATIQPKDHRYEGNFNEGIQQAVHAVAEMH